MGEDERLCEKLETKEEITNKKEGYEFLKYIGSEKEKISGPRAFYIHFHNNKSYDLPYWNVRTTLPTIKILPGIVQST